MGEVWAAKRARFAIAGEAIEVRYVAAEPGQFGATVVCEGRGEGADEGAGDSTHSVLVGPTDETSMVVEIDSVRRRFLIAEQAGRVFVHGPIGTVTLDRGPEFMPASQSAAWNLDPAASRFHGGGGDGASLSGGCVAPSAGVVRAIAVAVGDPVTVGQPLVVVEAMKMEHALVAASAGVVSEVRVECDATVDSGDVLIVVEMD